MKSRMFYLAFAVILISSCSQNVFDCNDFDYYNRDTSLVIQYQIIYDSLTKSEMKAVDKIINNSTEITDKTLVDTVPTPRYKIHFSGDDTKRLENLILCCLDWLLTSKIDSDEKTWNEVEKFVLLSNSVSTPINEKIIEKLKSETKNDEMILRYYRLGVIKHITLKIYEPDDNQIQLAGLLALNQLYIINPKYEDSMPQVFVDYNKEHDKEILLNWINDFKE